MRKGGWCKRGKRWTYKDEHGCCAKDEAANGRDNEDDAVVERPSVYQQSNGIHGIRQPHVLTEPVLGQVDQLAVLVISIRLDGLPRHNLVNPSAPEYGRHKVPQARGDVHESDDDLAEIVRRLRELLLDGNVGDEERPKGNGGGEDGDEDGREAQEEQHAQGVDEDALRAGREVSRADLGGLGRRHAADGRFQGGIFFFLDLGPPRQRLRQAEDEKQEDGEPVDGEEPHGGLPPEALGQGAAHNRRNERRQQRPQVKGAHGAAPLARLPDVGNGAGADGLDGGGGAAGEDAEDDEHGDVGGDGRQDGEDEEEGEGDDVDGAAAKLLREGRPPEGEDGHGDHVEGHGEVGNVLRGVEALCHFRQGGCELWSALMDLKNSVRLGGHM